MDEHKMQTIVLEDPFGRMYQERCSCGAVSPVFPSNDGAGFGAAWAWGNKHAPLPDDDDE